MSKYVPKVLKIAIQGDDVLNHETVDIRDFGDDLKCLVDDMFVTMYHAHGIGLAGPQVNESLSLCVIDVTDCVDGDTCTFDGETRSVKSCGKIALINPNIVKFSKKTVLFDEGCLSVPNFHGVVERPDEIVVRFCDTDGNSHKISCGGIFARCMQHEIDHLHGILFTSKVVKK